MAKQQRHLRSRGFSLVEMLIAVAFTGILMAGMAQVFKSSLGAFTTSGEILSAARRNRASIDMLNDDLNNAGMFLTDLSSPPLDVVASNPAFYIVPNAAVTLDPGLTTSADGPATADQLLFYFDQPLPFEGTLGSTTGIKTGADLVLSGDSAADSAIQTYTIDCGNRDYANQVKDGMSFVFRDSWESRFITSATPSGTTVTVVTGAKAGAAVSGIGSTGSPAKVKHIPGSGILFFMPAQMVRYSIKYKNLDPQLPATGIPCLVRHQMPYSAAGFNEAAATETVITENVSGFKVYLSADAGENWAGIGAANWAAIRGQIDTQLVSSGRQGFTSTKGSETWFREIPVLVRLDITTRTAVKRNDYYDPNHPPAAGGIADFNTVTQSLVVVPRHFGLALR
jgi:prepilin-type N-terminal cleavage/methylation domain-containing protein